MVGKGVLACCMMSLRKWSINARSGKILHISCSKLASISIRNSSQFKFCLQRIYSHFSIPVVHTFWGQQKHCLLLNYLLLRIIQQHWISPGWPSSGCFGPSVCHILNWVKESCPFAWVQHTLKSFGIFSPKLFEPERSASVVVQCFSSPPLKQSVPARNVREKIFLNFSVCALLKQMGIDSFTEYLNLSLPCDSWLLLTSRRSHPFNWLS